VVLLIGFGPCQKSLKAILKGRASGARVVLVVVHAQSFSDIPPDVDFELPYPELRGLNIKRFVSVHVFASRRYDGLDVVRVVSPFHLYVIKPQRLLLRLISKQNASIPNTDATAQRGEQQHDCQNTLQKPHFQSTRGCTKDEGFGGRTFNNGRDSGKPCDQ